MARPLIATKLFIPKVQPQFVSRSRLMERLRRGAGSRLTLVCAPAGFGKTTLLAEWLGGLAGEQCSVAWVSLDAADSDPATFWAYVLSSLQSAVPDIRSSALELFDSPGVPTESVLTTVLNDLTLASVDVWLVLDDYHLVDNAEVGTGMVFLLEHLPPQVHVMISTRADPSLPLARWRVRGELVEVRGADLRFTSEEAGAYLNEAAGLGLSASAVSVLEQRTEGWIAALQLAALSLQGRQDVAGFIAGFAGDDRYIVDYLVEEVLEQQPEPVRTFLLDSAVLDRLSGPLCDAVTGRNDGAGMLEALERANLFVVPLDDRRVWYRYHHLFADVLRARLFSQRPDVVPVMHQRASAWFEHNEFLEEAVRHSLAARDFGRAAYLMELNVPAIRRYRQEAVLFGWLKALPEDYIRQSPVLSVFDGFMLMVSGEPDGAEDWFRSAERALAAVPFGAVSPWAETEELWTLPATIAVYRASLAQARGDAAGTARHARRALDLAGPVDHLARGAAAGFLGLAAWAEGDLSSARRTFTEAVASLHASGNLIDALSSTVVLADMWLAAGRPTTARQLYQDALQPAQAQGEPVARAMADLHVGLSEIDYEAGDLAGAEGHLSTAAAYFEQSPVSESRYRWFVASAVLAQAGGHPDDALDLLGRAEQLYRPGFFPELRPIAAVRARVWIAQGRLSEAADWARILGVSVTDEASYLREFDHLTLVRLVLAQHREHPGTAPVGQAVLLLERLRRSAETGGRPGSTLEISMLQALLHYSQGQRAQARTMLGLAFAGAPEPGGYARLFLAEGAPMMVLLRDAAEHGTAGGHPQRLLSMASRRETQARTSRDEDGTGADPGRPGAAPAQEQLSVRELQVLRLLAGELSGPEIARALFISHNTFRTHTKHIFTKLEATTRQAAVRRARERGYL